MTTFTIAGGCFWCLDAVYRTLQGVSDVVSGYTGGTVPNPSYEAVCTGRTGHAEAVQVTFDPAIIPAEVILDTQYRSAMFFVDEAQEVEFDAAVDRASDYWDGDIVTTIQPLGDWYPAEEYHQDFFAKNPGQGYCLAVALPKVNKIRKSYGKYVLAS
jgi:peptide-methionine (S)-S-oxide reductase